MLFIQNEVTAKKELLNLFKELNYVDGMNLTKDEVIKETRLIYWNQLLENQDAAKKDTYIVYTFLSNNNLIKADDKNLVENVTINLDLITGLPFESKTIFEIRKNLELGLEEKGFSFIVVYKNYDPKSKLTQLTYQVSKIYG